MAHSGPKTVADEPSDATASAAAMLRDRVARMREAQERGKGRVRSLTPTTNLAAKVEVAPAAAARPPVVEPTIEAAAVEPRQAAERARRPRRTAKPAATAINTSDVQTGERKREGREPRVAQPPADPGRVPLLHPTAAPDAAMVAQQAIAPPDQLLGRGELRRALEASRRALHAVGWFSCGINVLMLAGPIFMLQVYDRVMASGSYSTLIVLLAITSALYGVIGMLEHYRTRLITRIGVEIDQRIGNRVFEASLRRSVSGPGVATGALRELDALRQFVAGPAPMTAFDLMWTPIYLLVIFATHWTLGIASVVGMSALLFIAWLSEYRARGPLLEAGKAATRSIEHAETAQRNADSITAMGMLSAYRARWQSANQQALAWQVLASDKLGGTSAISKTLRLLMQSLMLALGAALAMHGDISSGAIIAGTIIFGRALAPVEQVITHWKSSARALEAYRKLEQLLAASPPVARRIALPRPSGHVTVEALRVAAPETKTLILNGINCQIKPGRLLAVIGPSASGKSTFVRALVGLWPAFAGSIKLDGVKLEQWDQEDLGQHVGYLPQDVELFAGTVRDNIARFRTDVDDAHVVAAAQAAHAHELILALPKGYDTELGSFGQYLSAGQRQRIGLSRALFGLPALVVLDEPNANLDRAGDEALAAAVDGMRARGQAIVMVSHRVQAISKADDLLYIERGVQRGFGPRDEVLRALNGQPAQTGEERKPTAQAGGAAAAKAATAKVAAAGGGKSASGASP